MADDQGVAALPDTVEVLRAFNGSVVYLVGTAHFSDASQEDVAKVINAVQPDCVVLELCKGRQTMLTIDESTIANMPAITLSGLKGYIKKLGFVQGIFYQLMISISSSISRDLGMLPGGEFRRAVIEAKKYDCIISLGDRPVDVTIKRVISMLSWVKCIKLMINLLTTPDIKITKEDVEKFKDTDLLAALMIEMAADYPELREVIVDERDKYLTYNLQKSAGFVIESNGDLTNLTPNFGPQVVVGIVGLGHIAGIKNYWQTISKNDVLEIAKIPPQSRSSKIIKIVIKVSSCCLLIWGVSKIPGVKPLSKMAYNAVTTGHVQGQFTRIL
ncbi:Pheromone shutdown, TraB [Cinara cedri]|uniref:Pheromone shutdown, TraB n=1 Tax=Cinara cedri TaxID=506608 RepID=A0A5E4N976_9HEMI|nr:Pheromone shutdown, TraB [Cinara cedri]